MNKEIQEYINNIEVPKTPHLLLLEGVKNMGASLCAIHNQNTWNIEALIFAIHLYDCKLCFEDLLTRWKEELPFEEAADVDFTKWKSEVWTTTMNIDSTFLAESDNAHSNLSALCDTDYAQFIEISKEHLNGEVPIKDVLTFLQDKNTNLHNLIHIAGENLSKVLSSIDISLTQSDFTLYEDVYHRIANEYKATKWEEDKINEYDHWKVRFSSRIFASKLKSKMDKHVADCKDPKVNKNWSEVWNEYYDSTSNSIDIEGIGRTLIEYRSELRANRYKIAELKRYHQDYSMLKDPNELMKIILLHELYLSEREALLVNMGEASARTNLAPNDLALRKFCTMFNKVIDDLYSRWNGKNVTLPRSNGSILVTFNKDKVKSLLSEIIASHKEVLQEYCYNGTQQFSDNDFCDIFSTLRKHEKKPFGELTAKSMAETIGNNIEIKNKPSTISVRMASNNADDTTLGRLLNKMLDQWQ